MNEDNVEKKKSLGSKFGGLVNNVASTTAGAISDSAAKTKGAIINKVDVDGKAEGSLTKVVGNAVNTTTSNASASIKGTASKSMDAALKTKDTVINTLDVNGNGEIDIEDIIIIGMLTPGVKINRADFLSKELKNKCTPEVIKKAIETTPSQANIPIEIIDQVADSIIQMERNLVSGISAALSAPGGVTMIATLPADIAQFYGYMLRTAQKLMYLYGFPQIDTEQNNDGVFDSATINLLTISLGVMYGVGSANVALKAMAKALGKGVEKQLLKASLTKGIIYPIVKSVAKYFNVKMTKQVFAGFFKKSIPVVGGVIGGGITYLSFKPCCDNLKLSLRETNLTNPNYKLTEDEEELFEAIEVEVQ